MNESCNANNSKVGKQVPYDSRNLLCHFDVIGQTSNMLGFTKLMLKMR